MWEAVQKANFLPLLHTTSQNKGHYLYKTKGWEREIDCWSYPYSMRIYIEIIIDGGERDIIPFIYISDAHNPTLTSDVFCRSLSLTIYVHLGYLWVKSMEEYII